MIRATETVDRRDLAGPFDAIGDIHGCADEFDQLLATLGHLKDGRITPHAEGRIPVLLGDLTDRGPHNLRVVRRARELHAAGGLIVLGNHCEKVRRMLSGEEVRIGDSLSGTAAEMAAITAEERAAIAAWLGCLPHHIVLAGGRLVVAHAGLPARMHGRDDAESRFFSLYGAATGTFDADGLPNATEWAQDYDGQALVIHGHVVRDEALHTGRVASIDTGCVYGGALTALRWPEMEEIRIEASTMHFASSKGRPGAKYRSGMKAA